MPEIRKVKARVEQIKPVTKEEATSFFEEKSIPESKVDMEGGGEHNHDETYLGINAKAADSNKLNGQDASYYATASDLGNINAILATI